MEEKEGFKKKEESLQSPTSPQKKMYFQHATEYEVLGKKGEGGMGLVEEAKDLSLGRTIVWKTIRFQEGTSPEKKRALELRFKQEAMIQAQLDHPHILPLYNIFQHQETGQIYFTMKKVEGKTLDQFLAESLQKVFQELKKEESESQILHLEKLEHFLLHEMPGLYTKAQDLEPFLKNDPKKNIEKQALKNLPFEKFQGILTRLRRKSESDVLSILEKVCNALAYAHGKGIIHRDLKPQNIMIENYGAVYVMDWGIAKLKGEAEETEEEEYRFKESPNDFLKSSEKEDALTQTSVMMGTENYMAPEQKRDAKRATNLSDIYSLGKVLHFCFRKIYGEKIPEDIKSIIAKATEKSAKGRYQKVTDILEDIERYRAGYLISARKYGVREIFTKWFKRNWKWLIPTLLFVLLIAGFLFHQEYQKRKRIRLEQEEKMRLFVQAIFDSNKYLTTIENVQEEGRGSRSLKIQWGLKALASVNKASSFITNRPEVQTLKARIQEKVLPFCYESEDFELAEYLVLETSHPEDKIIEEVRSKKIEQLTQHQKSLEQWIIKAKQGGLKKGEVDDFIFEVSQMKEQEIYGELLKEYDENEKIMIEKNVGERSSTLEEYANYIVQILGRLGHTGIQSNLIETLEKMEAKISSQYPLTNVPTSELDYMVVLAEALGNLNAISYSSRLEAVRTKMGRNNFFFRTNVSSGKIIDGYMQDLSNLIQQNPQEALAYKNLADAKQGEGDLDGAISDYTLAIQMNPQYAEAYNNRGYAKKRKGDLEGAILDCTQAIQINSQSDGSYKNRGIARYEKNDFEGAIEDYTEAIKLNPQDADLYSNRGNAKFRRGHFEGAIEDYKKAIKLNPQDVEAYSNRGNVKIKIEDLDGAIIDFTISLLLNPKKATAYIGRGIAKKSKKEFDEAILDYTEAIRLDPQLEQAYSNRGVSKLKKGDIEGAIADYTQAITLNPQFADPYLNRGYAKYKKGNLEEAISDLEKGLSLQKYPEFEELLRKYLIEQSKKQYQIKDYIGTKNTLLKLKEYLPSGDPREKQIEEKIQAIEKQLQSHNEK
jgi:serine/threonine protein kinase/Flp pilus assembly protein TadD